MGRALNNAPCRTRLPVRAGRQASVGFSRLLKNVIEAAEARQKQAKKRSLVY